ncbi:MAG: hypothetical protein MSJ26_08515 [Oscillospiraceae bacterium]|nr:hypothetical protein [Oscillospiraceae bacterium]
MSFRKIAAVCTELCLTASMTACGKSTEDGEHGYLLEFVDNDSERYGLDGRFNATPLYLASGMPAVSISDGKLIKDLNDTSFERAMQFQ